MDFGGRYLKEFDLDEFFNRFNQNMKRMNKKSEVRTHGFDEDHTEEKQYADQASKFVKDTVTKFKPMVEDFEQEVNNYVKEQQTPHYEPPQGLCPLCFFVITISAFVQACLLLKHAKACAKLKELKDW